MTDEVQEHEGVEVEAVEAVEAAPETPIEAPQPDPSDVEEARLFGWKSPDEWVGDKPPGYIDDPKRFLDRVKDSRIFKTVKEQSAAELAKIEERMRKLDYVAQQTIKSQREDYERRIADIEQRQRRAIETADVAAFDALEKQKRGMSAPQDYSEPVQQAGPSPVVVEYAAKNDWVNDPALRTEGAIAIDSAMKSGRVFRDDAEQIEYAESVMRRKYPHMFQSPAPVQQQSQPAAAKVDGGGLASGGPFKTSAFSKLPSDAVSAFNKGVSDGLFTNDEKGKAEFARLYNEG